MAGQMLEMPKIAQMCRQSMNQFSELGTLRQQKEKELKDPWTKYIDLLGSSQLWKGGFIVSIIVTLGLLCAFGGGLGDYSEKHSDYYQRSQLPGSYEVPSVFPIVLAGLLVAVTGVASVVIYGKKSNFEKPIELALNEVNRLKNEIEGIFKEMVTLESVVTALETADRAFTAGRFEDAAEIIEGLGLLEESGQIRNASRRLTVKTVNVDLTSLVERLKTTKVTFSYKCRSCGAMLEVSESTRADDIAVCRQCGSANDVEKMLKILSQMIE